jgi:hypothetical protein
MFAWGFTTSSRCADVDEVSHGDEIAGLIEAAPLVDRLNATSAAPISPAVMSPMPTQCHTRFNRVDSGGADE